MKIMLRRAWDQTRLRIVGALFTIALVCAPLAVSVWGFDYIDELSLRIFMSAAAGVMLVLMVSSEPRSWRDRWESLWLSLILYPLLIFAIAHEFDITPLAMNAVIAFVAVPCCWCQGRSKIVPPGCRRAAKSKVMPVSGLGRGD